MTKQLNPSEDMMPEDAAEKIEQLRFDLIAEEWAGTSNETQHDICMASDYLSLAYHSMRKAQINHTRELVDAPPIAYLSDRKPKA